MTNSQPAFSRPRGLAVTIAIIAILMIWPGAILLLAGGSIYYLLAGIALAVCSYFLFKGDKRAAPLYGILLITTYLWAMFEVGLDAWALMPRVAMFSVLGIGVAVNVKISISARNDLNFSFCLTP